MRFTACMIASINQIGSGYSRLFRGRRYQQYWACTVTKNLLRNPQASLLVLDDGWYGEWVQLDGRVEVVGLPDAMQLLVEYYRRISGEHPDWDDYMAAMERDQRVILRLTIERAGPDISG